MLARRLLLFALVLLVVTALSSALAPPPRDASPPPRSETGTEAAIADPGTVVERTVDAARPAPERVVVQEGDVLALTVANDDEAGSVELQGLAGLRAIAPGTPVVFDVLAASPGDYPVVFRGVRDERTVATVRVVRGSE